MRGSLAVFVAVVVCATLAIASTSVADVLWGWSFSSEAGTFVTDGTMADTAGSHNFTIIGPFEVTASAYPSMVGATYDWNQPPQGMIWDGTAPTQFWRAGGTYTNGANFFSQSSDWWYGLEPGDGALLDGNDRIVIEATLTVTPLGAALPEGIPIAGRVGLALLGSLIALAAVVLLRRA